MKKERRGNRGRRGARPRKREEGSEKDRERRSERIAASECKSTASDQSTTRTTRNRKDSFFLLIFVKFPPPPATPPPARSALSPLPSVQRSHLFCLLAGYFSLGGVFAYRKKASYAPSRWSAEKFCILSDAPFRLNRSRSRGTICRYRRE